MDRLTIRNSDGSVSQPTQLRWADALKKLAEYEDLDEAGLLIRLPVKIGSTVYTLKENYFDCERCAHKDRAYWRQNIQRTACDMECHCPLSIQEHVVEGFDVLQGEAGSVAVSGPGEWGYEGLESFSGFEGKWYRTREEAEARLAELHETEAADEMPVL